MSRERLVATAICELLAVIGLIVPPLVGIAPALSGWAAIGLAVVMVGAISMHSRLAITRSQPAEWRNVAANLVILAICVFVAEGRLG